MATCNSNNGSSPPEIPAEGSIKVPRSTSARQAKPKKQYPPGPPGKVLKFRWWRTDPKTGRRIYARGRPFPMWVDP